MNWFEKLCRNTGLMVHNLKHPTEGVGERKVVKKEVREERRGNVTLRRTTIDEIEVDNDGDREPPKP